MRRSMKKMAAVSGALAAALTLGPARAEQFGGYAPPSGGFNAPRSQVGDRAPLRVQVTYQVQLPSDRNATLEDQAGAIVTAHAALYDLAKRECDLLVKDFDGDCRVVNLSVSNAMQTFGPSAAMPFNASATIEMTPRPAAPAPKP